MEHVLRLLLSEAIDLTCCWLRGSKVEAIPPRCTGWHYPTQRIKKLNIKTIKELNMKEK